MREVAKHLGVTTGRVHQLMTAGQITPCGWTSGPGGKVLVFWPKDASHLKAERGEGDGRRR